MVFLRPIPALLPKVRALPTPSASFPAMLTSVAMRHPKEGAPYGSRFHYPGFPVINAGDGGHQHPTQTLADLLTIRSLKGRLDNLTIGLCGDLKFGRTVHSLINALVRYTGIRFVLISPEELRLPSYVREDVLDKKHIEYEEVTRLEDALPELDVLYMTRVQKERFFNEEDYVRMKDFYILDKKKLELAPADMLDSASASPCQRDRRGSGRRSQSRLFQTGYSMPSMFVWH